MKKKWVMVLGRFRGGVRQRDIRDALRAAGHRITGSVRRAEAAVAGSRAGRRLSQAQTKGIPVLSQDQITTLAPGAPPGASPSWVAAALARLIRPPRRR